MIPKIEFRYSSVYDRGYRENFEKRGISYPKSDEVLKYIKKVNKTWKRDGKKILKAISNLTKLKWNKSVIICYVIGMGRCFSDPLTIKMFEDINDFRDTLIHELIHQMQTQNKLTKWFNYIYKKYEKESILTKNHILLDAFLSKIIIKLYNQSRLDNIIKKDSESLDYKRAWEIVEKETSNKILNKFYKMGR